MDMIRVSVEVRSRAVRFRTAVWAESIERAVRLAGMRYPGSETSVLFPIEPEGFFAKAPVAEVVRQESPSEAV
jgi:hypothetical protein